jgi:hypothetical protein
LASLDGRLQSLTFGVCLLLAAAASTATAADKPLKVFILAGQSNMQGHASISTLDSMADDPKTAPLLKEMRAPDGKLRVCERVWISSVSCLGDAYTDLKEKKGKLTAGFGAPTDKIGPEFTFGLTMEELLDESSKPRGAAAVCTRTSALRAPGHTPGGSTSWPSASGGATTWRRSRPTKSQSRACSTET